MAKQLSNKLTNMLTKLSFLIFAAQMNLSVAIKDIDKKIRVSSVMKNSSQKMAVMKVNSGQTIRLLCQDEPRFLVRWTWRKKDQKNPLHFTPIVSGGIFKGQVSNSVSLWSVKQEDKIKVEISNTAANLVIGEVTEDDGGDYICEMTSLQMTERQEYMRKQLIKMELDISGQECSSPCGKHMDTGYSWCWKGFYWNKDWDYCSLDSGHTRYGVECENICSNENSNYFWCYKIGGGWDYCSPEINGGQSSSSTYTVHVEQQVVTMGDQSKERRSDYTGYTAVAVLAAFGLLIILILLKLQKRKRSPEVNVETTAYLKADKDQPDVVDRNQNHVEINVDEGPEISANKGITVESSNSLLESQL